VSPNRMDLTRMMMDGIAIVRMLRMALTPTEINGYTWILFKPRIQTPSLRARLIKSDASLSGIYSTMRYYNSNPCSCSSSFDTANLNLAGPAWKGSVCRRGHMCYPHTYRYGMLKTAHIILTLPLPSSTIRTYDCDICHMLIDQGTCGARCKTCGYDVCSACKIPDTAVYPPIVRDCWLEEGLIYVWLLDMSVVMFAVLGSYPSYSPQ
jgi:hypothetical protein